MTHLTVNLRDVVAAETLAALVKSLDKVLTQSLADGMGEWTNHSDADESGDDWECGMFLCSVGLPSPANPMPRYRVYL